MPVSGRGTGSSLGVTMTQDFSLSLSLCLRHRSRCRVVARCVHAFFTKPRNKKSSTRNIEAPRRVSPSLYGANHEIVRSLELERRKTNDEGRRRWRATRRKLKEYEVRVGS